MPGRARLVAARESHLARSVFPRTLRALRRRLVRRGEWSRAANDALFSNLSEVWSPAWRKRLSDQQSHASLELDLRSKLGGELFELLHAVANRLESHEHRGVALAYLAERLKHPAEFEAEDE